MIIQGLIYNKEMMENARIKLTEAYNNPDTQKMLLELTKTSDVKVFNANVLQNKDKILAACGLNAGQSAVVATNN
jgi:hypothetical protein